MARTVFPRHAPMNWSPSTWGIVDDDTGVLVKPDATDTILFTINSGDVTCDEQGIGDSLFMGNYAGVLDLVGFGLDIGAVIILDGTLEGTGTIFCGGDFETVSGMTFDTDVKIVMDATTGSLTITSNGVTMGNLEIDDSAGDADFTFADDLTCVDFTLTDGVLVAGSGTITTTGDLALTGGAVTPGTAVWEVSSEGATVAIDAFARTVAELSITAPGAGITLAGTTVVQKLSGSGDIAIGNQSLLIFDASAGWWSHTGAITGAGNVTIRDVNPSPGADITVDVAVKFLTFGVQSITIDGNITLGSSKTLRVYGSDAGNKYTATMAPGMNVSVHNLKVGTTDANTGSGCLAFGEDTINEVTGAITAGNPTNDDNAITFKGVTTIADPWNTQNIPAISSSGTIVTTGGITIDSDDTGAANDTTWTLAEITTFDGDVTIQQTAGTTIFFIGAQSFTFTSGSTLTQTAGTITSVGGNMHGGAIVGVSPSNSLHCWGVEDGGGNSVDVMHEGSNAGAALGGMQSMIGAAA